MLVLHLAIERKVFSNQDKGTSLDEHFYFIVGFFNVPSNHSQKDLDIQQLAIAFNISSLRSLNTLYFILMAFSSIVNVYNSVVDKGC